MTYKGNKLMLARKKYETCLLRFSDDFVTEPSMAFGQVGLPTNCNSTCKYMSVAFYRHD